MSCCQWLEFLRFQVSYTFIVMAHPGGFILSNRSEGSSNFRLQGSVVFN